MAGRQNYTQRKTGMGSRRMWLERNLGRSTSKAARLRGEEQKQSCAYKEKARGIRKDNNQNQLYRNLPRKRVTQEPLPKCCLQQWLWLWSQNRGRGRALAWYLLSYQHLEQGGSVTGKAKLSCSGLPYPLENTPIIYDSLEHFSQFAASFLFIM